MANRSTTLARRNEAQDRSTQPQSLQELGMAYQTMPEEHELVCLKQHVQGTFLPHKAVVDGLHQMCNEQRVADQLLQHQPQTNALNLSKSVLHQHVGIGFACVMMLITGALGVISPVL